MTVFLVGLAYAHYLSTKIEKEHGHAAPQSITTPARLGGSEGNDPTGQPGQPQGAGTAPPCKSSLRDGGFYATSRRALMNWKGLTVSTSENMFERSADKPLAA